MIPMGHLILADFTPLVGVLHPHETQFPLCYVHAALIRSPPPPMDICCVLIMGQVMLLLVGMKQ